MLRFQYDEEVERRVLRKEAIEEGRELGLELGLELGREEGREEGASQKAIEVAKTGLENDIPIETISIMTGMPVQEIEKLKDEIN